MTRFPARRYVWSARAELPEVGPLLGIDQPPGHEKLFAALEDRCGADIWSDRLYGGWLELAHGRYRISAQPGDGFFEGLGGLSSGERTAMVRALQVWAQEAGVPFDRTLPL